MPMVELDEAEYKRLHSLNQIATAMTRNPKSAKLLEEARKIIDPNAPTPLIDREKEQMAPIEAIRAELAAERAERAKEKSDREQSEKLSQLRGKIEADKVAFRRAGWTDEGIAGVEKLMEEKGMLDFGDAAVLFERANPPAAPAVPGGGVGGWNFFEGTDANADIKKLIETKGQFDPIAEKMAADVLREMRSGVQRR